MNKPNVLLYKWMIINSFSLLILYVSWMQGWIGLVIESDQSYLSTAMALIFVVFWVISTYRMLIVNREIERSVRGAPEGVAAEYFEKLRKKSRNLGGAAVEQSMLAEVLRIRLMMPVYIVNYASSVLILLGLIGTVVGFVIAVGGLGDSLGGGENIGRIQGVLGQIVNGMGVALFTTLVGSVLGGLWLQLHYQMLSRAIAALVVDIVEHADIEVLPALAQTAAPRPMPRAIAE